MKTENEFKIDRVFVNIGGKQKIEAIFINYITDTKVDNNLSIEAAEINLKTIWFTISEYIVFCNKQTCENLRTCIADSFVTKPKKELESDISININDHDKSVKLTQITNDAFYIYENNVRQLQALMYYKYQNTACNMNIFNKDLNRFFFTDIRLIGYDGDGYIRQMLSELVTIASTYSAQSENFDECFTLGT
ncbi:hypothetical protein COBT_000589 [Conglomerata obtusa]